jgi:hypothetical protein
MPSESIVSLHGINRAAFEQSWSVIVKMVLYPLDSGSLTIKSRAKVWNGCASKIGVIGYSGGLVR